MGKLGYSIVFTLLFTNLITAHHQIRTRIFDMQPNNGAIRPLLIQCWSVQPEPRVSQKRQLFTRQL